MTAGAGTDTLSGEADGDSLVGEAGTDSIDAGAGDDTLEGGVPGTTSSTADAATTRSTAGPAMTSSAVASTTTSCSARRTAERDVRGGAERRAHRRRDTSFGGPDTIVGQNDSDSLTGGLGGDLVDGSFGNDVLDPDGVNLSEAGVDTMLGNSGTDTISQFEGTSGVDFTLSADALDDGTTTDSLEGFEAASLSAGVGGNEFDASGFFGPVTLDPGDGDDTLTGGPAADSLIAGIAGDIDELRFAGDTTQNLTDAQHSSNGINDTLSGLDRASLAGGASANQIDASAFTGPVTLDGQSANDTLLGALGFGSEDSLIGGAGTGDRVSFTEDQPQVLSDTQHAAGLGPNEEIDTLSGVEQASLTGGVSGNDFDATAFTGAVTLDGAAGDDTLRGSDGGDSLVGGSESDRVIQSVNASQTLTNSQLTGIGTDTLSGVERASLTGGGAANDLDASAFSAGPVSLDGVGGDDTLLGGSASDSLVGGTGAADRIEQTADANQTLTGSSASGDGNDTINGIEAASLTGGASPNDLDAASFASGPVTLDGLGGSDTLRGTPAGDSLHAGTGSDRMISTADADLTLDDTLLAVGGGASDTISGFDEASLIGGGADNDIDSGGFSGPTTLSGLGGDDTLGGGESRGRDRHDPPRLDRGGVLTGSGIRRADADDFSGGPVTLFGDGGFDSTGRSRTTSSPAARQRLHARLGRQGPALRLGQEGGRVHRGRRRLPRRQLRGRCAAGRRRRHAPRRGGGGRVADPDSRDRAEADGRRLPGR